jgi:tRNA (guanine-N7-)-methyltransferase
VTRKAGVARPGTGLAEDGRHLREVTSYARRGSRLTPTLQEVWDRHAGAWLVDAGSVAEEPLRPLDRERWFGRTAPLVVEIGSGTGEALVSLAAARPDHDVLALEVWRPGVARTFRLLEQEGVGNVRLLMLDAVWCLEHLVGSGDLAELWTFFPDPWHKKRHHKRRLVSPAFAALVADRLEVGGTWRLATDWSDYAEHVDVVLAAEPRLEGGRTARWAERPVTKFERRGVAEGRAIVDFCYRRR